MKIKWHTVKLKDIVEINPKETLSKGIMAKKITMDMLQPYCRDIPKCELAEFSGGAKFRNGDTIMARITPCLENGKIAKVSRFDENEVGFGSTEFIVFRAIDGITDEEYVYYLVCSHLVRDPAIKSMVGSSGRQRVQTDVLHKLEISVPDLDIQQKIGSMLSLIDDKIAQNTAINENLEQQAQAIFKFWFVDFEPFGGVMPNDWHIDKLGRFVEIKRGGSPRPIQDYLSDTGYRWLKISDVTGLDSPYVLEIKEHINESGLKKTVMLKQGSLVLSNSATPGIPKILDVDSCIHDGWLYFPQSVLSNEYLYLLFKTIRNDLVMLGNGSVFTNLKTDILRQFEITIPISAILGDFQAIIAPLFETMKNIARENQSLASLRDTLLPKLMNGEVDVSKVQV